MTPSEKHHSVFVPAHETQPLLSDGTLGEQNADVEWENVPEVQLPSRHRSSQPSLAACWSRHSFHRAGVVVVLCRTFGEMLFSPLLSNDRMESFLRTQRCCCVLLCGLLMQQRGGGRVSHLCVLLPPRHELFLQVPSDQLTRPTGVGMPRQGGGWSALSRKEQFTVVSALHLNTQI